MCVCVVCVCVCMHACCRDCRREIVLLKLEFTVNLQVFVRDKFSKFS